MDFSKQHFDEPQGRDGWELFFARWRESGGRLSAFCRERGVSYQKAKYWKKRLGMVKPKKERQASSPPVSSAPFAEVLMDTGDLRPGEKSLTIDLPSGARISVGSGADLMALRAALEVLSR